MSELQFEDAWAAVNPQALPLKIKIPAGSHNCVLPLLTGERSKFASYPQQNIPAGSETSCTCGKQYKVVKDGNAVGWGAETRKPVERINSKNYFHEFGPFEGGIVPVFSLVILVPALICTVAYGFVGAQLFWVPVGTVMFVAWLRFVLRRYFKLHFRTYYVCANMLRVDGVSDEYRALTRLEYT